MSCYHYLWVFMKRFLGNPNQGSTVSGGRYPLTPEVRDELIMGLSLIPLCFMDLRSEFSGLVTCSDASETGGGVCASQGLSLMGELAVEARHLPERAEHPNKGEVLAIGLFDGIRALQVALST